MSTDSSMSIKEVEDLLLSESASLLNGSAICDIWSDGCMEQDDIDCDVVLSIASPELKPWQKNRDIAYADFSGMLEIARLSISLTCSHADDFKNNIFSDGSLFELHWLGSVVNLNIASDRMRDWFVTAVFEKTVVEYKGEKVEGVNRNRYQTPFLEADAFQSSIPSLPLKNLGEMGKEVYEFRKKRNAIIHEVATQYGRFEQRRLNGELSQIMTSKVGYASPHASCEKEIFERKNKISRILDDLKRWYELLLKFRGDIRDILVAKRESCCH